MKRDERRLMQAIHDATGQLLAAQNYAETYMGRVAVAEAITALYEYSHAALVRQREAESTHIGTEA